MSNKEGGGGRWDCLIICVLCVLVCARLGITDWRTGGRSHKGDVRQWRECEHRNNGVRESTSEEDEKSNQSIQLGVYQLCMASVLFFLGKKRRGIG